MLILITEQWRPSYRVLTTYFLAVEGPSVHGLHFLVPCCYAWPVVHHFCRQWLNSACTLISLLYGICIKHQCEFYKVVWLHKLHQNVWQRVSGLCPGPLWRVHEREGKKAGLTEGQKWPQAWTPQDLWQIAATEPEQSYFNDDLGAASTVGHTAKQNTKLFRNVYSIVFEASAGL